MSTKRSIDSLRVYLKRKYDFLDDDVIDKILIESLANNDMVSEEIHAVMKNISDENILLSKEFSKKFSDHENQTIAYQLGSIMIKSFKDPDFKKTMKSLISLRQEYNNRVSSSKYMIDNNKVTHLKGALNYTKNINLSYFKKNKLHSFYGKIKDKKQNFLLGKDQVNVMVDVYEQDSNVDSPINQNILKRNVNTLQEDNGENQALEGYELVDKQKYIFDVGLGKFYFDFKAFNLKDDIINNAALIGVNLLDDEGNYLMPLDDLPINKSVGSYIYIESSGFQNPKFNEIILNITDSNVKKIELQFFSWKKEIEIYVEKEININYIEGKKEETIGGGIENFIETLTTDDKVILLYTTAPYIEHETLELRPNRMAKEYMNLGYKVIFFSFSRVPENLVNPPKYNNCLYQCLYEDVIKVTSLISDKKLLDKIFICSSFPDILALTTMNKLKLNNWKLVYEVRDDMEEFNRVGYSRWYNSKLEIAVVKTADKVITVSPRLAQKMRVMAAINESSKDKVQVIQNAAPDNLIDKTKYLRTMDAANKRNSSQIIGYIGHLTAAWFDWTLIINSAKSNPSISYEIIGHGMPKNIDLPENIIYLGPKTHDEFIEISKRWRAGLIPFIKSPLTYGVDPNKVYEYLAVGLMVLTADMGSVKECPATYVYDDAVEFEASLKQIFSTSYKKNTINEIKRFVQYSRWSLRAEKLLEGI